MLEGLRGEESIAELCRREGIATSLSYKWSKEVLEAGKKRLAGNTARQASAPENKELRSEAAALKGEEDRERRRWRVSPTNLADVMLENRLLKKSMLGDGADHE